MTAIEAVHASVAFLGHNVSIVPVDGEERESLRDELTGICEHHTPVDRNGDCRFIGTDPDGKPWRVALLAVRRRPHSMTYEDLMLEHHEVMARARHDLSLDLTTALVLARRNVIDQVRENDIEL